MYSLVSTTSEVIRGELRKSTIAEIVDGIFSDLKKSTSAGDLLTDMHYIHEKLFRRVPFKAIRQSKQLKIVAYFVRRKQSICTVEDVANYVHMECNAVRPFLRYMESFDLLHCNKSHKTHLFTWRGEKKETTN